MGSSRRLLITLSLICFFPLLASFKDKKTTTVDEGALISVRVMNKISVQHLKPGDQLEFKCYANVFDSNHDHIVLPKGATIHGIVTESIARDESHPESKLAVRFDRANWDNGTASLNARFFGRFARGESHQVNFVTNTVGSMSSVYEGGNHISGPGKWAGPQLVISPDPAIGPTLVSYEHDIELDAGVLFTIRNYPQ
jgi:hypothetical protein